MTGSGLFRPVFTHLGGRGNRVSTGCVGRFAFAHDNSGVAINGHPLSRVLELLTFWFSQGILLPTFQVSLLTQIYLIFTWEMLLQIRL